MAQIKAKQAWTVVGKPMPITREILKLAVRGYIELRDDEASAVGTASELSAIKREINQKKGELFDYFIALNRDPNAFKQVALEVAQPGKDKALHPF